MSAKKKKWKECFIITEFYGSFDTRLLITYFHVDLSCSSLAFEKNKVGWYRKKFRKVGKVVILDRLKSSPIGSCEKSSAHLTTKWRNCLRSTAIKQIIAVVFIKTFLIGFSYSIMWLIIRCVTCQYEGIDKILLLKKSYI